MNKEITFIIAMVFAVIFLFPPVFSSESDNFSILVKSDPTPASFDDNIILTADAIANGGGSYIVSQIQIFFDNSLVQTCTSVWECIVTLPSQTIGLHSAYALATAKDGSQKKSDILQMQIVSATIHHSPANPTPSQQAILTLSISSGASVSSAEIFIDEYVISDAKWETKIRSCASFPCSVTVGPYPAGRRQYFATFQEGTNGRTTSHRDLWVYTTETYKDNTCKNIYKGSDSSKNLNLVFVGNKYSTNDFSRYASAVEEARAWFLSVEPYKSFSNSINMWRFDDFQDLSCGQTTTSCLLNTVDVDKAKRALSGKCPADQIMVFQKNDFAGVSFLGGGIGITGDNTPYIAVHEFGHSFGSLLDERGVAGLLLTRDTPNPPINCYCVKDANNLCRLDVTNDPKETNKLFVDPSVACPAWADVPSTGCFIGCGNHGNWFRSSDDGIMRTSSLTYYSPVSEKHLAELLKNFGVGSAEIRQTIKNVGKRTDTFQFTFTFPDDLWITIKSNPNYQVALQKQFLSGDKVERTWGPYGPSYKISDFPEWKRGEKTITARSIPADVGITRDGLYEFRLVGSTTDINGGKFDFESNYLLLTFVSQQTTTDIRLNAPIVVPSSPTSGATFEIQCPTNNKDYDCVDAYSQEGKQCKWKGLVAQSQSVAEYWKQGWQDNAAVFICDGLTAGNHQAICKTRTGTPDNCKADEKRASYEIAKARTQSVTADLSGNGYTEIYDTNQNLLARPPIVDGQTKVPNSLTASGSQYNVRAVSTTGVKSYILQNAVGGSKLVPV